jgi:hypothetical protein
MPLHERLVTDSLLLAPQAMTNSATVTANLDCQGAAYATVRVALASEINTNAVGPTLSLLESDDTVVTNFATVTADRTAEDITGAKEVTYGVDMRGRKRYLRLSVSTETTTNDNVTVAAVATLSRQTERPAGTTDAGDVVVYV